MSVRKRLLAGVGNAGVTMADLLAVSRPAERNLLAVNTDQESLASCVAPEQLLIPSGDPVQALASVAERLEGLLAGVETLMLFGALGGEAGSSFLPALAEFAKARGVSVQCCVGMPFSFEGASRKQRSREALEALKPFCEAMAVIEYDRFSGAAGASTAVGEAFRMADETLLAALRAMEGMAATTGPVRITRGDLQAVLGPGSGKTHFGAGMASGENRLHEAMEKALKSPLLALPGKQTALRQSRRVLLLLKGGKDISFAEVQTAVSEIERNTGDGCQIKTGVEAVGAEGAPLEILIFATAEDQEAAPPTVTASSKPSSSPAGVPARTQPPPTAKAPSKTQIKPPSNKPTQATLPLETNPRGRFDKSEPTIVEGEDLDVPTFLRKGIKLPAPQRK